MIFKILKLLLKIILHKIRFFIAMFIIIPALFLLAIIVIIPYSMIVNKTGKTIAEGSLNELGKNTKTLVIRFVSWDSKYIFVENNKDFKA